MQSEFGNANNGENNTDRSQLARARVLCKENSKPFVMTKTKKSQLARARVLCKEQKKEKNGICSYLSQLARARVLCKVVAAIFAAAIHGFGVAVGTRTSAMQSLEIGKDLH